MNVEIIRGLDNTLTHLLNNTHTHTHSPGVHCVVRIIIIIINNNYNGNDNSKQTRGAYRFILKKDRGIFEIAIIMVINN